MIIYVSASVAESGNGTEHSPFRTIQEAALSAVAGDEIIVLPGVYREHVNPIRGGTEKERIIYRSSHPLGAKITGAEPVRNWTRFHAHPGVWQVRIPNRFFGEYNPYTTRVSGDWFIASFVAHTGEVYLGDKSLYETETLDGVLNPVRSETSWDPDFSVYTWYTEQDMDKDETIIYANFHEFNPNSGNVEINVRPFCFYPLEEGCGYITLSGFEICRAATQWAPPTAYQVGMVGPHWSKGWIIEDCNIYQSKCSGISLGKYLQPGNDNKWLHWKLKDGTQTERDAICQAQLDGWSKETIGSHLIRNCEIHDCGQTGIVGHLGGVFSRIEHNHIHHINNKQNLAGAEIGGIKMHAAIDVVIEGNHFHHCTRGLWLDWQAQGTRVTGNVFHDNTLPFDHLMNDAAMQALGEDIFVEVSHGPTLIDHNLLLSERALKVPTQGMAVVHNLIAGSITCVGTGVENGAKTLRSARYTPYHVPHQTGIAGFMSILHGDMRFYNNIFVQMPIRPKLLELQHSDRDRTWDTYNIETGTFPYDGYQDEQTWLKEFEGYVGMGSAPSDRYYIPLPVWSEGNVYLGGARACTLEKEATVSCDPVRLEVTMTDKGIHLATDLYAHLPQTHCRRVDTERMGLAFEPEMAFENPDGTPICMDRDFFRAERGEMPMPGPFEQAFAEMDIPAGNV